jgi:hypothetical protein
VKFYPFYLEVGESVRKRMLRKNILEVVLNDLVRLEV